MGSNPLLHFRIWGGFFVLAICAAYGLRLVFRGIRGDVCDTSGTPIAGRGWFIAAGVVCFFPLVAYFVFVWKQGYFTS